MYVAVLPRAARNEAGGDPSEVVRALYERLGREGTYAVVVGDDFRAGSSILPPGKAASLAEQALAESGSEGIAPTLLAFVSLVGEARSGAASDEGAAPGFSGSSCSLWSCPSFSLPSGGGGVLGRSSRLSWRR